MNDMSPVIEPHSDQVNSDDLIAGSITITIRDVQIKGGQDQPVSVYFEGSDKAFRPCKSMARVMVAVWGADSKQYLGRSLTLYRDPNVKWGGVEVGGIRISHMSHMDGPMTMALTATKGSRKPYTVDPIVMQSASPQDTARNALMNASTLDELRTVWISKGMAPFRDGFAELLATRKAELATPESQSSQPSTSDFAPPVDDPAAVTGRADEPEQKVEAGSSNNPLWRTLVEGLAFADNLPDVEAFSATFDANEDEIPIDRLAEIQDAIIAARARFTQEG
jgi:hypothetical protein